MFIKKIDLIRNRTKVLKNSLRGKIKTCIVFLCMATLYFSCNTEDDGEVIEVPQQSISIQNGMLKFASIKDYEDMLSNDLLSSDNLENSVQSYTAFNSLHKEAEKRSAISSKSNEVEQKFLTQDAPILNVLNKDGMLTIGKWTLLIDLNHGIVGVTSTNSNVAALKSKDFTNPNLRWFGTEDDVLSLLEDNTDSTLTIASLSERMDMISEPVNHVSRRTTDCVIGESLDSSTFFLKDKKVIKSEVICDSGFDCKRWLADAKHVYQKAGIYFSLQSKIKYRGNVGCSDNDPRAISTRLTANVSYSYERRRRFRKNEKKSGSKSDSTFSNELNIRSYEGSRSLKKYELNTTFTYERKDDCLTDSQCATSNPRVTIVMPRIKN
ncbi:hypothetical protein [uncultured Tenacibaculum sp.]|uniref:hypothetical protein n=1 Tax=uncultured Tenacibaculum sp. TaxID=174713 RepID=UPI00262CC329|nr:hypothetical protein [uncultured Tenacibaculum sp.]